MYVTKSSPIGVFDSGVGGLTVVKALVNAMPNESFLYFGDTAHVPYGNRPPEELKDFALQIGRYLEMRGCKMIIIACNTSSALAFNLLCENLMVPVIGVIEPVIDLVSQSKTAQNIGVIATQATVNSGAYQKLFAEKQINGQLYMMPCPAFVPLIEAGITSGPKVSLAIEEYLGPLKAKSVDTLIMGCTHYPFLADAFRNFMGYDIQLLDPAIATIEKSKVILKDLDLLADEDQESISHFVSSGDPQQFWLAGKSFLPNRIKKVDQIIL